MKLIHYSLNSLSSQIEYSLIYIFPTSFGHDSGKGNTISDEKNQETKFPPFGLINSQFGSIWHAIDTFQYSADGYTISNLLSCFGYVSFFPSMDKKKREREILVSL